MSIKLKFFFCTLLIVSIIALFVSFYYPRQYEKYTIETQESTLRSMAEMVAIGIGTGHANNNFALIKEALDWAKKDKNLAYLIALDSSNNQYASYNPKGLILDPKAITNNNHFIQDKGFLSLAVPVINEGKNFGTLVLGYSLTHLDKSVAENRLTSIKVSLGILILGVALSFLLGKWFIDPLLQLKTFAGRITKGEKNVPINITSNDEVGDLSRAFTTMVKKLEHSMLETQSMNKDLQVARDTAVKSSEAKSRFLSGMSHELRTPLNAILGFSQLLEYDPQNPLKELQQKRVSEIIKAGEHLLTLINEILDLASIESGKLNLTIENISLSGVLLEAVSLVEPQAQKKKIQVVNLVTQKDNFWVKADRTRLKQTIINLLSNAVKYNRENGSISIKCRFTTNKKLNIFISDTGNGIPEDKIEFLFEPFNRLNAEHSLIEGTGIGLNISKSLMKLMNGSLSLDSTSPKGTTFKIEIPCGIPIEHPVSQNGNDLFITPVSKTTQEVYQVLYVEDNPANFRLVKELIADREDIRLLYAKEAQAGISLASKYQPDLILMDINLPDMDGVSAMKMIKKDPKTRSIRIIAISANAMKPDIEKALESGFDAYLTKPLNLKLFLNTINDFLKPGQPTSSAAK